MRPGPRCVTAVEETQGPYWFDVDSIRSHIREDRPGKKTVLTTQHVTNATDSIYDDAGLLTVVKQSDRYLAAINLGIDV